MDYKLTLEFSGNTASVIQSITQHAELLEGVMFKLSNELTAIANLCNYFKELKKQPVPVPTEEE